MIKSTSLLLCILIFSLCACYKSQKTSNTQQQTLVDMTNKSINPAPDFWKSATVYFLLTDRFANGNVANDVNFNRTKETGTLRGFMGGDIKGITQKIEDGYFTDLGISAIWFTPVTEQIHEGVDEGTGFSYGFHGYWAKDWTKLDPNFGTEDELAELVQTAHDKGIRIVMDAVINHTGPATAQDTTWPSEWVRTEPACTYDSYKNTTACTLVTNLPDIKTENNTAVDLPPQLVEKWKAEGRYEQEMAELDAFFERTAYPRAPRFYIMKWLSDYVTEYGIDGFRVDTVKHTEEYVWAEFKKECDYAFAQWKTTHPDMVLDDTAFYMVGEIYNYNISAGKSFDFGDKKVNYFANGFNSLINFEFKHKATGDYESLFAFHNEALQGELKDFTVLNYLTSHDDGQPFDKQRTKPYETATKLLLSPGQSQVYYGDESARVLDVEGTQGDATLRSFMNWEAIANNKETQDLLTHWQKLGQFRAKHPSIGAGTHKMQNTSPYVFSRALKDDQVLVGLDFEKGIKQLDVNGVFEDEASLRDAYSGNLVTVKNGKATIKSDYSIVLLEKVE
jgi:alpha-amylase